MIANFPRQLTDGSLAHIVKIARMFGIDLSGLDCRKEYRAHQTDMSFFPQWWHLGYSLTRSSQGNIANPSMDFIKLNC